MNRKAALSVVLAGVLWGIISLFVRRLNAAGLGAMPIALVRMAVSAAAFTGFLAVTDREKLRIRPRDWWMFAGTGIVSVTLFNGFYFTTIQRSEASVAVVLLYTSPVFVMLLSALLFHERITARKLAALGMTFAGCVLVAGLTGGAAAIGPDVLLFGLASGLFYALYTIFGRVALGRYDTMTVTAYTFLFGLAGSLPLGEAGRVAAAVAAEPGLIWYCLGIGVVCTVLPYLFYTWGLERMESGLAAILVAVEPLVGALIGMTLYQEDCSPSKLAGIALILGSILVLSWPERVSAPSPDGDRG